MKIEATPEMLGKDNEEGMLINLTMRMKAYDYNEPVGIILPIEAQKVEENIIM